MTVNCKSLDDLPAMLTAAELAGALGISRAGAYALIHRKDFPTLQIGKSLRYWRIPRPPFFGLSCGNSFSQKRSSDSLTSNMADRKSVV